MAIEYRVAWPAVSLHIDGSDVFLEQGSPLPGTLDTRQRDALAAMGAVHVVEVLEPSTSVDTSVVERPVKRASKAEWTAYAVTVGIPQDTAAGLTKDELIAAVEEIVGAAPAAEDPASASDAATTPETPAASATGTDPQE